MSIRTTPLYARLLISLTTNISIAVVNFLHFSYMTDHSIILARIFAILIRIINVSFTKSNFSREMRTVFFDQTLSYAKWNIFVFFHSIRLTYHDLLFTNFCTRFAGSRACARNAEIYRALTLSVKSLNYSVISLDTLNSWYYRQIR